MGENGQICVGVSSEAQPSSLPRGSPSCACAYGRILLYLSNFTKTPFSEHGPCSENSACSRTRRVFPERPISEHGTWYGMVAFSEHRTVPGTPRSGTLPRCSENTPLPGSRLLFQTRGVVYQMSAPPPARASRRARPRPGSRIQ